MKKNQTMAKRDLLVTKAPRWIPIKLRPDPKLRKQFPGRRAFIMYDGWYPWNTLNLVADTSKGFSLKKDCEAACQQRNEMR